MIRFGQYFERYALYFRAHLGKETLRSFHNRKPLRYEDMENDVMFLMSKYPDMVVPKKKRDGMPHITLKKLPPIFFDL